MKMVDTANGRALAQWEASVVSGDRVRLMVLCDHVAGVLYPDIPSAGDRLAAARRDGGPFFAALEAACSNKLELSNKRYSWALDEADDNGQGSAAFPATMAATRHEAGCAAAA